MYTDKTLIEILRTSKAIRKEHATSSLSKSQKESDIQKALKKIFSLASDYGFEEKLDDAVLHLVREVDGKLRLIKSMQSNPLDLPPGWTPIKNKDYDERFIDTIFVHPYLCINPLPNDFTLLETLSGIELFSHLELNHSRTITLAGLGKCETNEGNFLLLAETHAPGKRFDRFLDENIENKQKINSAIEKVAVALAELHTKRVGKLKDWSNKEKIKKHIGEKYKYLSRKIPNISNTLKLDDLYRCLEEASKYPYLTGYTHGDLSLINFLYDEKTDLPIFIDLETSSQSINRLGDPIGFPAEDFCYLSFHLEKKLHQYPIDEESKRSFLDQFENVYLSKTQQDIHPMHHKWNTLSFSHSRLYQIIHLNGGSLPKEENIHFSSFSFLLRMIEKTLNY